MEQNNFTIAGTIKRMIDLHYTKMRFYPHPRIKHANGRYTLVAAAVKDGKLVITVGPAEDRGCLDFVMDESWNKMSVQNILGHINKRLDDRAAAYERERYWEEKEKKEMERRKLENYKKDIKKSQRKDLLEAALAIYGYAEPTVTVETTVEETLEIIETPFGILVSYELTVEENVTINF